MLSSKEQFVEARKIYDLLEDEESKIVFKNRLLYLVTGERKYIHHMVEYNYPEHYQNFAEICKRATEIVLYGAGDYCYSAFEACLEYADRKPDYICDSNEEKWGKIGPGGLQVISPEELKREHKEATVIISTVQCKDEIMEKLKADFPDERVFALGLNLSDITLEEQYFDKGIVSFDANGEYFVDGGAFDLKTSLILSKKTLVKKVYAFEADLLNKEKIEDSQEKNPELSVELHMQGLWDKQETLFFESGEEMESKIADNEAEGNSRIEAVSLDEAVNDKVTFIKMDIEGAELKALQGAKNTIMKQHPKLAICVYHKPEDMIDIPSYIHEIVPEYKLYMRHYADFQYDTVLYAVP